jgi:pSer/pThr/pTyr-binding forkhead associated (FHA) protein
LRLRTPRPTQTCPKCGATWSIGATRCDRCSHSTTPERKPERKVRWRRGYQPAARPPTGLRGALIRLFGGDVPAWPPPPEPLPASSDPDSIELPEHIRRPAAGPKGDPPRLHALKNPVELPPAPGDLIPTQALPPTGLPDVPPAKAQTAAAFGIDVDRLKAPRHPCILQVFDANGKWRDWGTIPSQGLSIGRAAEIDGLPALRSLAKRHMRLSYDGAKIVVEDLGSINGICKRLRRPTPLVEGSRFRIGGYLFAFHDAAGIEPSIPLISDDGEEFAARDPVALAYLDLIGADGTPRLRIPVLRAESTAIGREPDEANIVFPDNAISARHAEIRKEAAGFVLEDLKSRNGTYIALPGRALIETDDVLLVGQMLFRIHDPMA